MLKPQLEYLLDERRICTLTTYGADDMPHVTAVWFLWESGALYIATSTQTSKGRNVIRDPRIAICVESRSAGREAGMTAVGRAEIITGTEAAPIAERVNGKYLTQAAMEHPALGPAFAEMSDLVIKLVPQRWISWDMNEVAEAMMGPDADPGVFFQPTLA